MDISKIKRYSSNIEDRRGISPFSNVESGSSFSPEDRSFTDIGEAIRIMLGDSTYMGTSDTIQENQRATISDYFNDPQRREAGGDEFRPADLAAMFSENSQIDPEELIRWIEELRRLQEFEKLPEINWDFDYD